MKKYISDEKNNVCTVDANGITPQMKCSCAEECEYICNRFNEDEEHEKLGISKKDIYQRSEGINK